MIPEFLRRAFGISGSKGASFARECNICGYRGRFQVVWKSVRPGEIPLDLLPKRQERRE